MDTGAGCIGKLTSVRVVSVRVPLRCIKAHIIAISVRGEAGTPVRVIVGSRDGYQLIEDSELNPQLETVDGALHRSLNFVEVDVGGS